MYSFYSRIRSLQRDRCSCWLYSYKVHRQFKSVSNVVACELQVWELLDRCNAMLKKRGTELLCEVHEHFSMQKRLAEKGFWVYDFALPMLTLQVRTISVLCSFTRPPMFPILQGSLTSSATLVCTKHTHTQHRECQRLLFDAHLYCAIL